MPCGDQQGGISWYIKILPTSVNTQYFVMPVLFGHLFLKRGKNIQASNVGISVGQAKYKTCL